MFYVLFASLSYALPNVPKEASCQQAIEHFKDLGTGKIKRVTTASELNSYGMRCYKDSRFKEASQLFRLALTLDEKHVLAHYNLACVLARLLDTVGPCNMDDEWTEIFHLLERAVKLDPKRADRARVDADFDALRYILQFRLSFEGQPTSSAEMASLFDGVTLWGETPGAVLLNQYEL